MINKFLSTILGVLFLFSAISKAIEIESFSFILMSFGYKNLVFFGPLITAIEFYIGLSFILQIYSKNLLMFSFWLIVFFTLTFLFGYIFLGIEDCGCFGNMIKLNPIFNIIRNCIVLSVIYFLGYKGAIGVNVFMKQFITVVFSFVLFFINTYETFNFINFNQISIGQRIELPKVYLKTGKQIWFIFHPKCKHCQTLTPKLLNSRESIIGIYSANINQIEINKFSQKHKIDFQLLAVNDSLLSKLTYRYPLLIKTENGIIKSVLTDL